MRLALICLALALLGAGCYGLSCINWTGPACPSGQHLETIAWIPITAGKVVIISPIQECERT
jgi:hypothetical protein